jgi:hypothetical protein
VSNRPAEVRQRTIEQIMRGARKQGAKSIEVRVGMATVVIPLEDDQKPAATEMEPPAAA